MKKKQHSEETKSGVEGGVTNEVLLVFQEQVSSFSPSPVAFEDLP